MHGSSLAAIWFGHRSWGKQKDRAYFFETTNCMHYDFHIVCHNSVAGRYSLPFMAATTASRALGTKQIAYIEEWLDLLYIYNNAPVSFHTRCKELASVKQLSNYHIVDDSLRSSVRRRHCRSSLTPAEKEFLCLMESGFSNRALCVIFRVGKVGSIYVKHHRIRAKIANENKSAGGD